MPRESTGASNAGRVRRFWLFSSSGMNFVAIGIAASALCFAVLTVDDVVLLCTGSQTSGDLRLYGFYLPLAAVASIFWAVTVFVWRPVLPKVVAGLASVAMASHIYQRLAVIPVSHLRVLALCRVLLCLALVFFTLRYGRESNG
jgi:hypothetical protein